MPKPQITIGKTLTGKDFLNLIDQLQGKFLQKKTGRTRKSYESMWQAIRAQLVEYIARKYRMVPTPLLLPKQIAYNAFRTATAAFTSPETRRIAADRFNKILSWLADKEVLSSQLIHFPRRRKPKQTIDFQHLGGAWVQACYELLTEIVSNNLKLPKNLSNRKRFEEILSQTIYILFWSIPREDLISLLVHTRLKDLNLSDTEKWLKLSFPGQPLTTHGTTVKGRYSLLDITAIFILRYLQELARYTKAISPSGEIHFTDDSFLLPAQYREKKGRQYQVTRLFAGWLKGELDKRKSDFRRGIIPNLLATVNIFLKLSYPGLILSHLQGEYYSPLSDDDFFKLENFKHLLKPAPVERKKKKQHKNIVRNLHLKEVKAPIGPQAEWDLLRDILAAVRSALTQRKNRKITKKRMENEFKVHLRTLSQMSPLLQVPLQPDEFCIATRTMALVIQFLLFRTNPRNFLFSLIQDKDPENKKWASELQQKFQQKRYQFWRKSTLKLSSLLSNLSTLNTLVFDFTPDVCLLSLKDEGQATGIVESVLEFSEVGTTAKKVKSHLVTFFKFLNFFYDVPLPDENAPELRVSITPREAKIITRKEFDHLLHTIDIDQHSSPRRKKIYKSVLILMYFLGLRLIEICSLWLCDIQVEGKPCVEVACRKAARKTFAAHRFLRIWQLVPKPYRDELFACVEKRETDFQGAPPPLDAPLFADDTSTPLGYSLLRQGLRDQIAAAGLDITPYVLRHSFGSFLLLGWYCHNYPGSPFDETFKQYEDARLFKNMDNLRHITSLMGQMNPDTTRRYYIQTLDIIQKLFRDRNAPPCFPFSYLKRQQVANLLHCSYSSVSPRLLPKPEKRGAYSPTIVYNKILERKSVTKMLRQFPIKGLTRS